LEQIISVRNLGNVQQVVQFLELGMFAALGLLYLIIFIFFIFLRRRPTDDMFSGGLNITNFVEMNFPT
jgi:hypothetical protein